MIFRSCDRYEPRYQIWGLGDSSSDIPSTGPAPRTVYDALFDDSPDVDDFQLIRLLSEKAAIPMPHRFDGIADWKIVHDAVHTPDELNAYVRTVVGGA